jgi:SPP1 family predicted phage head-tail adaptor
MRDGITIQRPVFASDGRGGQTISNYEDVGFVYAQVLAVSAERQFLARQVDYRITHRVKLRHSETTRQIQRGYRIIFTDEVGERFLFVEETRDLDNKRRWAEIDCSEDQKDRT